MLVQTTKGLIDSSKLKVKDIVTEHDNSRVIATEWYLNGELVRRDVAASILRTPEMNSKEGVLSTIKKMVLRVFIKPS